MRTIHLGLFHSRLDAWKAKLALRQRDFVSTEVEPELIDGPLGEQDLSRIDPKKGGEAALGAVSGLVGGAVVVALLTALLGMDLQAVFGATAIGGSAGALLGALGASIVGMGGSRRAIDELAHDVNHGRVLLRVEAVGDDETDEIHRTLDDCGAIRTVTMAA